MKQLLFIILFTLTLNTPLLCSDNPEQVPYPVEDENRLLADVQFEPRFVPEPPFTHDQLDSVESVSQLLQTLQERLAELLDRQNGLASRHHWEYGARIDRNWDGRLRWIDLKSSKGTGNATVIRITNRTVICFHTHPRQSVPQLSYHDRENARQAYSRLCDECRRRGIAEPEPAWFITVQAGGELWAWRPGMKQAVPI